MVRQSAFAKAATLSALAVLAIVSVASGLDRHAALTGEPNPFLPSGTPGNATAIAKQLVNEGQAEAALPFAATSLARDPLRPGAVSLLGTAAFAADDPARGHLAMVQSARLGWRDPAANAYWLQQAVDRQASDEAVLRFDLLYRTGRTNVRADLLLNYLDASTQGRRAILSYLSTASPGWSAWYWGTEADPALVRDRAEAVVQSGLGFDCGVVAGPARRLYGDGWRGDAERLWRAHCGANTVASPVADPSFETVAGGGDSPFRWSVHRSGDVTLRATGDGIELRNRAATQRLVLSQPVDLAAGRYALRTVPETTGDAINLSLDCGTVPLRPARSNPAAAVDTCERQVLGLWVAPRAELTLRRVALQKVER